MSNDTTPLLLKAFVGKNRIILTLMGFAVVILLAELMPSGFYFTPEPLAVSPLPSKESLEGKFDLRIRNERIAGFYSVLKKLVAADTVFERLEKPLHPLGKDNYRTNAMRDNTAIKNRIDQLEHQQAYVVSIFQTENLATTDDLMLFLQSTTSIEIDPDQSDAFYWVQGNKLWLRLEKNKGIFSGNSTLGSSALNLNSISSDTAIRMKLPIAQEGTNILLDQNNPNLFVTLLIYPINLKKYLTGSKIAKTARTYSYNASDSTYTPVSDSVSFADDVPLKQFIIPAKKRYTALILYYDDMQTNSLITCSNMDSVDRQPGIFHPQFPIMVAAANQRQSLLLSMLAQARLSKVRLTLVAASSNRYEDLKEMYLWFVKSELKNMSHRGTPLSQKNMQSVAYWLNEQFNFRLNQADSLGLVPHIE